MGAVKDRRIRFGSRSIVGLMCALGKQFYWTVLHISKLLRSDVLRASAFLRGLVVFCFRFSSLPLFPVLSRRLRSWFTLMP